MNFALTDEQLFLREAARGALGRFKSVQAARELLEGGEAPDLWPTACEAGWPGLLVADEHGGAGLGALEAMLVFSELGRVLAAVPLLGHVAATSLLTGASADELGALASGLKRAALVGARPPSDVEPDWTVDPAKGMRRDPAPRLEGDRVTGAVHWVPDAPGADVLAVVAIQDDGSARAVLVDAGADGVRVEALWRYDATRSLGHVTLDGARGVVLDAPREVVAQAWYLAQALLAAESIGAVEVALETSLAYAKERFTFGRAIGSYQSVKHELVEILRRLENARSLMYYAGWAYDDQPTEFPLAASALRVGGSKALEHASRAMISIHGGIGATWEHDAPLFFRRAQLSRRLMGGAADAAERVAAELLAQARTSAADAA